MATHLCPIGVALYCRIIGVCVMCAPISFRMCNRKSMWMGFWLARRPKCDVWSKRHTEPRRCYRTRRLPTKQKKKHKPNGISLSRLFGEFAISMGIIMAANIYMWVRSKLQRWRSDAHKLRNPMRNIVCCEPELLAEFVLLRYRWLASVMGMFFVHRVETACFIK